MTARNPHPQDIPGPSGLPLDDYLWDGSGPCDEQIAALERALSPLRWQSGAPAGSHLVRSGSALSRVGPLRAAAALGLLIAGTGVLAVFSMSGRGNGAAGAIGKDRAVALGGQTMVVRALEGAPRVEGRRIEGDGTISAGQWLETDTASSAQVVVGGYGTVKVDPGSRLRLVHAREDQQRLELARGGLSAVIAAPPRLFIVDTPAAAAVDLGCAYRLIVDDTGDGEVEVTLGWVSMESDGRESIVPYGARCITRRGEGVGTPFFGDASAKLVEALRHFDFGDGGEAALEIVLREAAVRDSLTLWHLLSRTQGESRGRVFDRLAELSPRPQAVGRDAVVRGDGDAIDAWRGVLPWSPSMYRPKPR